MTTINLYFVILLGLNIYLIIVVISLLVQKRYRGGYPPLWGAPPFFRVYGAPEMIDIPTVYQSSLAVTTLWQAS